MAGGGGGGTPLEIDRADIFQISLHARLEQSGPHQRQGVLLVA